jgi:hypothetical protein
MSLYKNENVYYLSEIKMLKLRNLIEVYSGDNNEGDSNLDSKLLSLVKNKKSIPTRRVRK